MDHLKSDTLFVKAINDALAFSAKTENSSMTKNKLLFRIREGNVYVSSTGIAGASYTKKIWTECEEEDSSIAVDGSKLMEAVKSMGPDAEVEFSKKYICLKKGENRIKLFGLNPAAVAAINGYLDVGVMDDFGASDAILPLSTFTEGIKKVFYARNRRNDNKNGIALYCSEGRVEIWTSDAVRGAKFESVCETEGETGCIIPADVAAFIFGVKTEELNYSDCSLSVKRGRFVLKFEDTILSSPIVCSKIMDPADAVKKEAGCTTIIVNTDDLKNAVNGLMSVYNGEEKKRKAAVIQLREKKLILSYVGLYGEANEELEIHEEKEIAEGSEFGINPFILRDAIATCDTKRVRIVLNFNGNGRPIIICPDKEKEGTESFHVILPSYIRREE